MVDQSELSVKTLGPGRVPSPHPSVAGEPGELAVVGLCVDGSTGDAPEVRLERAGPRPKLRFDPATARVGVVTCGGVCPGLNNVVRAAVLELHHRYRVKQVLGFRYGYEGLTAQGVAPLPLGPDEVRDVHRLGGTFLGTSRGEQAPAAMVDRLEALGVQALIAIGGDGTLRGAHAISEEASRRGLALAVVGVPKSIDNDVPFVDRTFGFETAVEVARQILDVAHTEAVSVRHGVALVRLMGREAGFVAALSACASADVNFCLVPEVPFSIDRLEAALERRLRARGHALVVVAEGCASTHLRGPAERDASGNAAFSGDRDVGQWLKKELAARLSAKGLATAVRYFDPSYLLRGGPANAADSLLADRLGRDAAHAAMAGRTDAMVGLVRGEVVHLPLELVTGKKRRIDPQGRLWRRVLDVTAQPDLLAPAEA